MKANSESGEKADPRLAGRDYPSCGYDLTGLPSRRCPECGRLIEIEYQAYDERPRTPSWMIPILVTLALIAIIVVVALLWVAVNSFSTAPAASVVIVLILVVCGLRLWFELAWGRKS